MNNNNYGNRSNFSKPPFQKNSLEKDNYVPEISANKPLDFENITVDLFSSTPKKYAEICTRPKNKKGRDDSKLNKGTQLRRFYDEFVMWTERSETDEKFKENLPFIYMIQSKVSYAVGRELVDENYKNMMCNIINGIKENNPKTLKNAKLFLEAFMGFFKELKD